MTEAFYPPLDEQKILLVMRLYENNPNFFKDPSCPYSPDLKAMLQGRAKAQDFDFEDDQDDTGISSVKLEQQIKSLQKELTEYGKFIHSSNDASANDRNTYFRISSALIEKMITMQERVLMIKDYEKFLGCVMETLDRELDADGRTRFLDEIKLLGHLTTQSSRVSDGDNNKTKEGSENESTQP